MTPELTAEQQSQLQKLSVPFHPNELSWRVTNKSRDGKRGCVIPYGDQRAYTDRLNDVFTAAGWTRVYETTTMSPIERLKKDKTIQTGKVIVTCVVTIHGLGVHSGVGEMWADDDNAMTRAEAQAFKRACSCFGLGRYFYEFGETWVDLDNYGKPVSLPTLPKWALPPGMAAASTAKTQASEPPTSDPSRGAATKAATGPQLVAGTLDAELTKRIESFRRTVGDALYFEVFKEGGSAKNARDLAGIDDQKGVLKSLELIGRGLDKVRVLASEVHQSVFFEILDAHKIQSVDKIPSFEVLKSLVRDLMTATHSAAA